MRYKLTGAGFERADGSWVETGTVFEPTESELRRRGYKLVPVLDSEGVVEDENGSEGVIQSNDWPLKMEPDRYLQVHPDGKYADLARKVLKNAD